jgi:hypothetical protein
MFGEGGGATIGQGLWKSDGLDVIGRYVIHTFDLLFEMDWKAVLLLTREEGVGDLIIALSGGTLSTVALGRFSEAMLGEVLDERGALKVVHYDPKNLITNYQN